MREGRKAWFGQRKQGAAIERAWRALERAARRESAIQIQSSADLDRPLERVREVGVDFRGVTER